MQVSCHLHVGTGLSLSLESEPLYDQAMVRYMPTYQSGLALVFLDLFFSVAIAHRFVFSSRTFQNPRILEMLGVQIAREHDDYDKLITPRGPEDLVQSDEDFSHSDNEAPITRRSVSYASSCSSAASAASRTSRSGRRSRRRTRVPRRVSRAGKAVVRMPSRSLSGSRSKSPLPWTPGPPAIYPYPCRCCPDDTTFYESLDAREQVTRTAKEPGLQLLTDTQGA